MKTLNTKSKRLSLLALAAMVIAGVCVVSYRAARAEDKTDFLAFGVSTITTGQTARCHAVSVGVGEVQYVELMFFDSQGNLLARSAERVLPGRAASLEFTPPNTNLAPSRVEVYAVMRFINGSPKRGYVIPTVEVIDNDSGKTIFLFTNPEG
ncbi:MAG TPA: hypothetical protein VKA60_04300 [Blastocatellia bacterium]|nr:hypothetical protein [Blastocatellia bacterium]